MTESDEKTIKIEVDKDVNPYRKPFMILVIVLCISLISQGVSNLIGLSISSDTNKVVGYIDDQTSPERQAEQEAALNSILITIDCNVRISFQEALDELERQGILEPDSVVITDNCNNTTTTTRD